jgi:hypothetical protein
MMQVLAAGSELQRQRRVIVNRFISEGGTIDSACFRIAQWIFEEDTREAGAKAVGPLVPYNSIT